MDVLSRHFIRRFKVAAVFVLAVAIGISALPTTGHSQNQSLATQQLFVSAGENDLAGVKDSLAKGADLSSRNKAGKTAIDVAVTNGHFDIVQFLLAERNKRIKARLGLEKTETPAAPPSRTTGPTRLEPVRPVESAKENTAVETPAPSKAVAPPEQKKSQPDLAEIKLDQPKTEPAKPAQTAPVKETKKEKPAQKRSSFERLVDRFLYRFGFSDDTPEPWKDNKIPPLKVPGSETKTATAPKPKPAPAKPETQKAQSDKPETTTEKPAKQAPAATAEKPLDEEQMTIEETAEPAKPKAPKATPKVAADQPPAQSPAQSPAARQKPAKPSVSPPVESDEAPSSFKRLVDKFINRLNDFIASLMGKKDTQLASKPSAPPRTEPAKPTEEPSATKGFLDTFKKTVDRVREKIIPGDKKPSTKPAKRTGPIIIARPGETPPPPPGQLIDDKPKEFTPEVRTTITKEAPSSPSQPASAQPRVADKKELSLAEKKVAELIKKQAELKAAAARARARLIPKRDKILSNKEVEDAIVQLGGSIKDLPVLEKPPAPETEAVASAEPKGEISAQRQAEMDVLDLLKSEASKITKKQPDKGKKDSKAKNEIEDALSMLAEGIEKKPGKNVAEKKPAKKPPVDDLEAALANIDSLTLSTPETDKKGNGKEEKKGEEAVALPGLEPGPSLPGLEPGPALPGLAPGPLPKGGTKKAAKPPTAKSPLDKLPPIKTPSKADRPPTKIGSRLEKEASQIAKKDPGFLERMTNVLQLEDKPEQPADKNKKKDKAKIPTSPESPSQWTAKVVKTTRLDEARKTQGGKRPKRGGPNKYLSGVSLTLGQTLKIGKEPLKKPEKGPDIRKPCITKRDGALQFCVEPVDWAASIRPYFEVNTIMYQGLQSVIRYDEGRASNFFTLFDSRAYKTIVDYYTKRFGPPTQTLQRGIAPLAQPRRANPVSIWRSIDPTTSLVSTLEIRQFDDTRVGFPDIRRGTVMLYHAWSEPIFPQLSALELMVLKPFEDAQVGAAPGAAPGTAPQANSKPTPNPFSSFP